MQVRHPALADKQERDKRLALTGELKGDVNVSGPPDIKENAMMTNLKGLTLAVSLFFLASAASAATQAGKNMNPDETPGVYPTKDSVFILVPAAAMANAAGFVVYRAAQPDIEQLNNQLNEMSSFYQQVFGKSEEEIKKELDELEKTNPDEYKLRKDKYQKAGEIVMANQDVARQDTLDKSTRFSNGELADQDFTIITKAPISPLKTSQEILDALGPLAVDVFSALKLDSPDAIWTDYAKSPDKYELLARFSIPVSRIFGRAFEDKDVKPEAVYYYKIVLVDATGREIKALAPVMTVVRPLPVKAVEGFNCQARDGAADISWAKPSTNTSAIGVNVYRGDSASGPFAKINKGIISITGEPLYTDRSLQNGKEYYFYIAAADIVGNLSDKSPVVKIAPRDMTPPLPPANMKAELKNGKALLNWDMSLETDMSGYVIYRSSDPNADYATLTATALPTDITTYTDESAENGKPYYYKITAADKSANFSAPSVAAQLMMPDTLPPSLPLGFDGKPAGKNTVLLTWKPSKETDLVGYNIYRGRTPDKLERANMETISKDQTKYEDNGVVSGETYYYALTSVDTSMNESKLTDPPLKVAAPDSIPPQYPLGLFALAEDGKATISWPANMESDLAGYRLYLSFEENGKFTKVGNDIPKDLLKTVDEPAENGKKRWYYLTAVDAAGNESEPSEKAIAIPFDMTPPAAPAPLAGELAAKTIKLTWAAPADKDIQGFNVWRSTTGGSGVYENIGGSPLPASKLSFEDKDIAPGAEYWYRVSTVDTSGNESRKSDAAGPFALPAPQSEGAKSSSRPSGADQQK